MFFLRCFHLIWIIPCSWIDAMIVRKKPFEIRYQHTRLWCKRLLKCFKIDLKVNRQQSIDTNSPILIVSNHQSFFDLMMLVMGVPFPFTFVSKVQNKKIPYLSSWAKSLELIYFDRDNQGSAIHMLRESARRLKSGKHLLIFPEGTRSLGKAMHPLMSGSLQPAFLSKATIVPIVLKNSYDYKTLFRKKGTAEMTILKPMIFHEYKDLKADGVAKQLQEIMQQEVSN